MSLITRVEVHEFEFDAQNLSRQGMAQSVTFKRGSTVRLSKFAIVIQTADGGLGGDALESWSITDAVPPYHR